MAGLNEDEHSLTETASEEDATAEALELSFGSGSYARRIMGNMGWKEVTYESNHFLLMGCHHDYG